jgi:hypothetical protein
MSLALCTIRFTRRTEKTIYVSGGLARTLQLTGTKTVTIKHGSVSTTAGIKRLNKAENTIYVPINLRDSLRLPRDGRCLVVSNKAKEIELGPLIGIMTSFAGPSIARPFGGKTGLIRSYLSAGANKAFYFAFRPKDVNWGNETIAGYFLGPNGTWKRRVVPLPCAVYNRLGSRTAEKTATMSSFKDRFTRRGIPLFNWSFFDKWDVYRLLEGDEMEKHVPESKIGPSPETLRDMLERHRFVYLKPTAGSLGLGIYRLTYHPKRGYFARYRSGGKNVLVRFSAFSGLMQLLRRNIGRMKNYVVQQGIRLVEVDGCPLDFRFHLHKNSNNQWVVAGIGAKKAGKGSVTTHVKNGGMVMTAEQALRQVYGSRADSILASSKQVAIKLAESIERNYRHRLGELGFDLGIDQKERIWMFEANAKPGRSIFKHPALKKQGSASLTYLFDHLVYLSHFRGRRDS